MFLNIKYRKMVIALLCCAMSIILTGQSTSKPPLLILDFEAKSMAEEHGLIFLEVSSS